jgi:alpha-L-fucosidase
MADVLHPRQEWLRNAGLGLFLHWGMRTSPPYADVREWEDRVTADGWTPGYWLDEAAKLHAGYLVLASFHSRLGYVRAWPSAIPGSPSTRRDFLGELLSAATARGLKILLYMTDDPLWHDEAGVESLDSAAYSAYRGRPVDLTTRDGFGEFGYDNFVEVMRRYPDLAGFWIDRENAYWRRSGLYDRVRAERPDWILTSNDRDNPPADVTMDVVNPGVLGRATTSVPAPRLAEACFTVAGTWWYAGTDPAVDRGQIIGRIVANAGASINSLLAFGAQHGGRFPPNQEAFNDFAATYLDTIWESIGGTEGAGDRDVAGNIVITVRRDDPDQHYLHVISRPSGDTIRIRDDGRRILEVRDVRTKDSLTFAQAGGQITISGITTWDPHDTVFALKLAATPQDTATPAAIASPTPSGPASPHPAAPENTPHHPLEGTSS